MAAQMLEEMVVGRSGNEVLAAVVERMEAEGIDGHIYTHPIGDVMRKSFFLLACALKSLKAAAGRLSQMRRGQTSVCGTCRTDLLRHPASWSCGRRRGSRSSSAPTRGCRSGEGSGSPSSRRRTQWSESQRREGTDGCTEEGGRRPPRCTLCGNRWHIVALHGERLLARSIPPALGGGSGDGPSLEPALIASGCTCRGFLILICPGVVALLWSQSSRWRTGQDRLAHRGGRQLVDGSRRGVPPSALLALRIAARHRLRRLLIVVQSLVAMKEVGGRRESKLAQLRRHGVGAVGEARPPVAAGGVGLGL